MRLLAHTRMTMLAAVLFLLLPNTSHAQQELRWETLAPGLEFAKLPLGSGESQPDSFVAVLRADPKLWQLTARSLTQTVDSLGLSTRSWAQREGWTAAINAGMYDRDRKTHIGLMVTVEHPHNETLHAKWQSMLVFDPVSVFEAPFAMLDREDYDFERAGEFWKSRLQNLRLIKHPGENRWQPGRRRWSEAAIGIDGHGRMLLLYCPVPLDMYSFNEALLVSELDVHAAQHLEGGIRAQLYIEVPSNGDEPGRVLEFHTGREFAHNPQRERNGQIASPPEGLPIPNVLGLVHR